MKFIIQYAAEILNLDYDAQCVNMAAADGRSGNECFSDYMFDGSNSESMPADVKGGVLTLYCDASLSQLWSHVEYDVRHKLTRSEEQALIDYTLEQLLDGIGDNFTQEYLLETGVFIRLAADDRQSSASYHDD